MPVVGQILIGPDINPSYDPSPVQPYHSWLTTDVETTTPTQTTTDWLTADLAATPTYGVVAAVVPDSLTIGLGPQPPWSVKFYRYVLASPAETPVLTLIGTYTPGLSVYPGASASPGSVHVVPSTGHFYYLALDQGTSTLTIEQFDTTGAHGTTSTVDTGPISDTKPYMGAFDYLAISNDETTYYLKPTDPINDVGTDTIYWNIWAGVLGSAPAKLIEWTAPYAGHTGDVEPITVTTLRASTDLVVTVWDGSDKADALILLERYQADGTAVDSLQIGLESTFYPSQAYGDPWEADTVWVLGWGTEAELRQYYVGSGGDGHTFGDVLVTLHLTGRTATATALLAQPATLLSATPNCGSKSFAVRGTNFSAATLFSVVGPDGTAIPYTLISLSSTQAVLQLSVVGTLLPGNYSITVA